MSPFPFIFIPKVGFGAAIAVLVLIFAGRASAADEDSQIIAGFLDHLTKIQNIRVNYTESRVVTPPGMENLAPNSQPPEIVGTSKPDSILRKGMVGSVMHGQFDSTCVFAMADGSNCFYQTEFSAATTERLAREKMMINRFEQVYYVEKAATRLGVSVDGRVRSYFMEGYPRPRFFQAMDVNLGLRIPGEEVGLDKERLAKAKVVRSGENIYIEVPGKGKLVEVLTVDPKKGYALIQCDSQIDKKSFGGFVCDKFEEVKPGLFLPMHATMRALRSDGSGIETQRCEYSVQRYSIGIEDIRSYKDHSMDLPENLAKAVLGASTMPASASPSTPDVPATTPPAHPATTAPATKAPPYSDEEALKFAAKLPDIHYPTVEEAACKTLGIDLTRIYAEGSMYWNSGSGPTVVEVQLSPHYWISFQAEIGPMRIGVTKVDIHKVEPATAPAATMPTKAATAVPATDPIPETRYVVLTAEPERAEAAKVQKCRDN